MICCCQEPIPKSKEIVCGVLFWGAVAVFVIIYFVLLDMAVEANKSYQKPAANYGLMLNR
jgi:hypothetical protein